VTPAFPDDSYPPQDLPPPENYNCRCIAEFGIFAPTWQEEIKEALTLNFGNTCPLLTEFK